MNTKLDTIQTAENKVAACKSASAQVVQPRPTVQRPLYDVSENANSFKVRVCLPGVNREGVDISLEDETLTVIGRRTNDVPEGWRPLRREIASGDFRLSLHLNVPINESEIQARVEDGVLDLSLPKADEVKPRKIQVS